MADQGLDRNLAARGSATKVLSENWSYEQLDTILRLTALPGWTKFDLCKKVPGKRPIDVLDIIDRLRRDGVEFRGEVSSGKPCIIWEPTLDQQEKRYNNIFSRSALAAMFKSAQMSSTRKCRYIGCMPSLDFLNVNIRIWLRRVIQVALIFATETRFHKKRFGKTYSKRNLKIIPSDISASISIIQSL